MKKWIFILIVLPTIALTWFSCKLILWILTVSTDGEYAGILTNPMSQYLLFMVLSVMGVVNSIKSAQKLCDLYIKPEYH